jgi:hypothetical protein
MELSHCRSMVWMLTKVTRLGVLPPYSLKVRFNDGSAGVHDCSKLVASAKGATVELRDPAFFARVMLQFGAPTWPNGVDMDAEWLRRKMLAAGELRPSVAAE